MTVSTTIAGARKAPATARRGLARIAPLAIAGLLIAAAGASAPGRAENASLILIPVALQSSQFQSAFAPFDTFVTPAASADDAGDPDGRTFRDPGQATSYFYGYQRLMETRQAAEVALRHKFNRQAFNDFILAQGLVPPALLRKAVMEEFVPAQR